MARVFLLGIVYAFAGVPHATIFGVLTAVAAMIPFAAPVIFGVAALILFAQGSVIWGIAVICIGFAITFAADHFVRPFLIGGATKSALHLGAARHILGGVEEWGLLGLFVGPAIMAVLILLWREFACGKRAARRDTGDPPQRLRHGVRGPHPAGDVDPSTGPIGASTTRSGTGPGWRRLWSAACSTACSWRTYSVSTTCMAAHRMQPCVDAVQVPLLDPLMLVPAMAAVTQHLGFGVTVNLAYEQPFSFARRMSTLDQLTGGRLGWNIVTGYLDSAARANGVHGADGA